MELLELTDMTPDGLAARLGRGEVPDFLQPVAEERCATGC